ncbi:MAG TPA: LuxR family transcriptional regulator [Albitalea sp.]|nr:LuxR family transcriptional regulator [Albitalea sp.]
MRISRNVLLDLLEAKTVADLFCKAKAVSCQLGFEHFIYGVRLHLGVGDEHEFVLSGYPSSWRQLYERENYVASDPTVAHCLSSNLPLVWSEQYFLTKGAAALMEDARQYGLRSGVTMPVHSSNLQTGLLSLAREACADPLDDDMELIAQSQLFATFLHEGAHKLLQRKERLHQTACRLTPREKECLTWAAAGKSSWEISKIVALSERTVNFHIGNIIQKLDVASRSQAVAKALAGGLIQL